MLAAARLASVTADRAWADDVRRTLAAAGDPARATGQQTYMKSEMPYHGLTSPELRQLLRPHLAAFAPADRAAWRDTVLDLWDRATHREQRYAATALARHRSARAWQDPESLDLYRHLVVTGAWWDHVDEIAAHLVGGVLDSHRERVTPVTLAWATDEDLWIRRTAVLSQLRHADRLDQHLLASAIEANLDDSSFWLRKAIGWALREHAKTDPAWVQARVAQWDDRISGLSRREALKHLS